jgi:hypothetical protein
VSWVAAITGFAVALGAMMILSVVAAAVLLAAHARTNTLGHNATLRAAAGIAAAVIAVQLIAYLWGGYTAGRMARGAGMVNGALVAVVAIVAGAVTTGVAWALDVTTKLDVAFPAGRLNLSHDRLVQMGIAVGAGSLVAMLIGGALGGGLGARWHSKLERRAAVDSSAPATRTVDLRDTDVDLDHVRARDRDRGRVVEEPADVETTARR